MFYKFCIVAFNLKPGWREIFDEQVGYYLGGLMDAINLDEMLAATAGG